MNKNIHINETKNILYLDKKRQYCLNQLENMDTAYNNNVAKKLDQELKCTRKVFKPQTLLLRDKVT
jgi:hypothetical protein